ncbi:hypothetical protein NST77_02830 [Niallia sp. FSL W8-0177]|uniref:hypothetical protein n=1 Tax=Niallia sp. FSL W8-0177 TaxID=2954522 RepID=UPI001954073F
MSIIIMVERETSYVRVSFISIDVFRRTGCTSVDVATGRGVISPPVCIPLTRRFRFSICLAAAPSG